ncbi:MAG TPA: ABC transporter permease [Casimicrobiaceae bacterium]|nr:ABC transporter permease [Casimicrobiaceae bacterium]
MTTAAPTGFAASVLRSPRLRALVFNVISVAVFLVICDVAAVMVNSPFFPPPTKVVDAFIRLATQGDTMGTSLWAHCWASLYRVLVGFTAGVILGVPFGLAMGLLPKLYAATRAIIEPFRFIPPIAWIPLAIIFFSGLTRFAFLIFIGAFFPVFTATLVGVARVEPIHRKVAVVYGASRYYVLTHIVLPTVLPDIMGGMRVGLGAAWLTIVAAELSGGTSVGLGRMMVNYAELLQIPEIIVGMALIGALGFALNEVLLLFERRLFRWRWRVTL